MARDGGIAAQAVVAVGPAKMLPTLIVIGRDRRQIARAFLKPGIVGRVIQLSLPDEAQRIRRQKVPLFFRTVLITFPTIHAELNLWTTRT